MAECNRISDIATARDYVKRKLGHPVICIEVADEQLDDCINDSIQDAARYLYGEGNKRDYMVFPITAGTSAYEMDCDIVDVIQFDYMSYLDGINVMHSPTNMLLYQDWAVERNYPGGPGSGGGGSLVSYDIAMMYYEEVKNQFKTIVNADYHEPSRSVILTPTPQKDGVGMVQVWKRSEISSMYDHPIVKKLMVARAMMQWGLHLSKYQLQMPGGGTANGSEIYQNGLVQEEKWFERLQMESEWPQFIIG
jgi:hypothetical protein